VDALTFPSVSTRGDAPPTAQAIPPVDGRALLRVEKRDGATRLADLYMRDPLRLLFPRAPEGEPFSAVLATTSGGLVGGDGLSIEIEAGEGAGLQLTGQALEKIYRSAGPETRVDLILRAGPGALLEALPQGTILFDGARLARRVTVDAAPDAAVMAGEIVSFGRAAMGERFARGSLYDRWEVRRGGRLIWADALALEEGRAAAALAAPSGLAGATALGTSILVAPEAPGALELARGLLDSCLAGVHAGANRAGVRAGASLVEGVLVARFLSTDGAALRQAFSRYWQGLRSGACGLSARLPAIWQI
jgi:urease accessory protein